MLSPKQIESIELEAWENMFDAASPEFKQQMNMYHTRIGGATCLVFAKYPVVHFNMVMGLGLSEPITKEILEQIDALYKNADQSTYMIHYFYEMAPANANEIFESLGFKVKGGWERITWKSKPLQLLPNERNITVKLVDENTATE